MKKRVDCTGKKVGCERVYKKQVKKFGFVFVPTVVNLERGAMRCVNVSRFLFLTFP